MKLVDVVKQLQIVLPQYTDLFSDLFGITSITASGNVATIVTDLSHDLKVDGSEAVTVANVTIQTGIDSVSQDGLVFTFTTSSDHDLTENWQDSVTLEGFTDSVWNDSFKLLGVLNRKSFSVQSVNNIPVLNSNEILLENRNDGINGRYTPAIVNDNTFTIAGTFIDGIYAGGSVGKNIRVAGVLDPEIIENWYTKQELDDFYIFVSMPDAVVSKDRNALSDATGTMATGQDIRMRILDGFNVTIVKNTKEDISAIEAIDTCRDTLLLPIMKSVFGAKFSSGLTNDPDFKAILTGHGVSLYNRAIIEYTYSFEVPMDLTNDDSVEPDNTHAFRDVDYTNTIGGDDTTDMLVDADLDDEPLT